MERFCPADSQQIKYLYSKQAGREISTAKTNYSFSNLDLEDSNRIDYMENLSSSRSWQGFLKCSDLSVSPRLSIDTPTSLIDLEKFERANKELADRLIAITKQGFLYVYSLIESTQFGAIGMFILDVIDDLTMLGSSSAVKIHQATEIKNGPTLLNQLRAVLGDKTAMFKSTEQAYMIQQVLDGGKNCLFSLPTGGGKSVIFQLPARIHQEKWFFIVMVPLNELLNDQVTRAQRLGITTSVWLPDQELGTPRGLVFVSCDHAVSRRFEEYVNSHKNDLRAIFIDEAHLMYSEKSYREALRLLPSQLRLFNSRIILLSATFTHEMKDKLKSDFPGVDFLICQVPLSRPNLVLSNDYLENIDASSSVSQDIINRVVEAYKSEQSDLGSLDRVIIYSPYKNLGSEICESLKSSDIDSTYLDGNMEADERKEAVREWREGSVMVATSAFGAGIDYPSVRLVIIAGAAYSLLDVAQQFGRAGRDGGRAKCVFVGSQPFLARFSHGLNPISDSERCKEIQKMSDFLKNRSGRCLKELLSVGIEGKGHECAVIPNAEFCEVCRGKLELVVELPMAGSNGVVVPSNKRRRIEEDLDEQESPAIQVALDREITTLVIPSTQETQVATSSFCQREMIRTQLDAETCNYQDLRLKLLICDRPGFVHEKKLFERLEVICEFVKSSGFCWYCLGKGIDSHPPHTSLRDCPEFISKCFHCFKKHSGTCTSLDTSAFKIQIAGNRGQTEVKFCFLCKLNCFSHGTANFKQCPQVIHHAIYSLAKGLYESGQEDFEFHCNEWATNFDYMKVPNDPTGFLRWLVQPSLSRFYRNASNRPSYAPNGLFLLLDFFETYS